MAQDRQLWEKALVVLRDELATASYYQFFSDLEAIGAVGDEYVLITTKYFDKVTLNDRYAELVEDVLSRVSGRNYSVVFITPDERRNYEEYAQDSVIALNNNYTFDTFVIGSSNRFAQAAALAVASQPGKSYNPLFIYGGVGLGKTHLMHAIGNFIQKSDPGARIMYVTSEKFTNELITSIRNNRNDEFRRKYRSVDVLMIDDIQFISNKDSTQEEFFHTFNTLHDAQKQIVISSDKPPKAIPTLEDRLRSRFEWGLIADIQPPDHETRVAILQNKVELENYSVDSEILHFIADKVETNIRELEGSLTRVVAYSLLEGKPLTISLAREALKDFFPEGKKRAVDAQLIKEVVAEYYGLKLDDLTGKKRSRDVSYPRQIAMYLIRDMTEISFPQIGKAFGGKDHTTVMHACEKIEEEMRQNPDFKDRVEDIKQRISQ